MIHFDDFCELLESNKIPYRVTKIYDEDNIPYNAIWLDNGHLEFNSNNILFNVITY